MSVGPAQDAPEEVVRQLGVSRETLTRLSNFVAEVRRWSPRINLVSAASLPVIWSRHVLDCAQLVDQAPVGAVRWLDLGSGGGFPGLVVAAIAAEKRPDLGVELVESDQRKAVFLNQTARRMDLNLRVHTMRAEELAPHAADVVSARALAPLVKLAPLLQRHMNADGVAILPKGRAADREIGEVLASWSAEVQKVPSRSDPDGSIVVLKKLRRV